jgi:hypothetical protein
MLRKALESLPKTLEETYARILANIDEKHRQYAIRILQFLTYSERPLTIHEVVDLIVVEPNGSVPFDPKLRLPKPREIMKICSSLVTLVTRKSDGPVETTMELQLAHFSVQQYLSSGQLTESFPKAITGVGVIFQEDLKQCTARGFITRVCLAYLCQLDGQCSADEIRSEFPLAQYSAQYWMDHAKPAEADKDVQERILNFLLQQQQAYAVWGELYDPDSPASENPRAFGIMATPLYYASLAGLHFTVELLLEKGANVNARGGDYGNALQAASARGHNEVVQLLLEKGATVNAEGGKYGNALYAASAEGENGIVQQLLAKGAKVNAQGGHYGNALYAACDGGHNEIARLLLEKGANVNA